MSKQSATLEAKLRWYAWREFDVDTLYAYLQLRSAVFVVEQSCAYADMDGLDPHCMHLVARDANSQLCGTLRLLPPGLKSTQPALGRLVVEPVHRGSGLARALMSAGIQRCAQEFPEWPIFLSGQCYLQSFYGSLGFTPISEEYLEDDIPHVDMLRAVNAPGMRR